ncbi:Ketosteroid isomerase-related protein [Mycobacterium numidiamassiliense]|jgi:steroid delta-isomerase|uniref:Ketosteroid isomerase-related protein n=1 Tax=Mycobacterium numidiamassiliense TaxID=1841861 RepID=A0A2U3PBR6_9MYCO|nr:nuclear transport factor 2 family protein [Mycobacterium numidiamassiliense]SPM41213.1 Ketosteroid isomerase-related protein [Mycobacterium numidiamassiliense]
MPTADDKVQAITDTVNRYIALLGDGDVDGLVSLYADDATVEDPVGGEVHIGSQAIKGFYSALGFQEANVDRSAELVSLRVAGNEAAFHFRLIVAAGDSKIRIEPIDTMVFNDDGKVSAMKAYWSAADVTQL